MTEQVKEQSGVTRRDFLKASSGIALGIVIGGALYKLIPLGDGVVAYAASDGYILVDTTECAGCTSCMAACSLAHEGEVNLSLSRIQILRNPLGRFPDDIAMAQCRQCVFPACAEACPTGALHVDEANGGVRMVDEDKCIGCMRCTEACPFIPARVQIDGESGTALKCDLCSNTPYWGEDGGPDGMQACVAVCPAGAIKFVAEIPSQVGNEGYNVDFYEEISLVRGWA